jgi:CheY-like chemotaxis protein
MIRKQILVVEDDKRRVEVFQKELTRWDWVHVDSVQGAQDFLQRETFHLIFLDHDLEFGERVYIDPEEEGTGFQLAQWISGDPRLHRIPVIVHSYNWFGANRIVQLLENAVYVPFGIFPPERLAELYLEEGMDPSLRIMPPLAGGAAEE